MSRRVFSFCLLVLAGACTLTERQGAGGRLKLERASKVLLDIPVSATWCAADTTVRITGSTSDWNVGFAIRTSWPPSSHEITIDSLLGGPGTSAFSARRLSDTIRVAVTSLQGTLKLAVGGKLAGTLEASAIGAPNDSVRITGVLDVPAPSPGGCPES